MTTTEWPRPWVRNSDGTRSRQWSQDADSVLDYTLDWSSWLAAEDSIADLTVTCQDGISAVAGEPSTTASVAWVSGGDPGQTYWVACHIRTVQGRQDDRIFFVYVTGAAEGTATAGPAFPAVTPAPGRVWAIDSALPDGTPVERIGPKGNTPWLVEIPNTNPRLYQQMDPDGPVGDPIQLNVTLGGYDVFLLAGQSNMQGADNAKDTAIDLADSRIFEWPYTSANTGPIQAANDPLHHIGGTSVTVGPGVSFARWYLSQLAPTAANRKVLLVPAAAGGTGFESNSAYTGRWKVGRVQAGETNLYESAIAQTNAAIAAAGPGTRFAGVLWCQGEDDGSTASATYQADLLALIDGFRSRITGATTAPFVVLSMVPEPWQTGLNAGRVTINNVHVDTPYLREYCGYAVGLTGHGVGTLGIHYDAIAQRSNGSVALAAAYQRALSNRIGTAPNAPTRVELTRDTVVSSTLNVNWVAATGRVTDYLVKYRTAEGEAWTTLTRSRSLATSATITGLGLGAVEVQVFTVNENGTSAPSTSARIALLPTPTVSVTQTSSDTVTVTTTPVLGSAAYRFDYKLSSGSVWTAGPIQTGLTGTISGLTTAAYDFRVTVFTSIGAAVVAATAYTLGLLPINTGSLAGTITGAYGLRKVLSGYAGNVVKVRRSSDNTEQNIGLNSNDLDTAALMAFVGAGDGFVSQWYDQSGNSRHMLQATLAAQPKIVASGVMVTNNGRPAVVFDGVDDYMERTTAELYSSGAATVCGVASGTSTANTQECVLGEGGTGSNNARYFINKCANAKYGFNIISDTSGSDVLSNDLSDSADTATFGPTPTQWSFVDTGTNVSRYRGGAALINNGFQTNPTYTRSGKTLTLTRQTIGALHRVAVSFFAAFQPSEFVIFNAAASTADRQLVEANQKTYFGTPAGL